MSLVPTLKRLVVEDFPEQQSWIGKLVSPLNLFVQAVNAALGNGLTWSENIAGAVRTLDIRSGDTLTFSSAFKPIGVWVVAVSPLEVGAVCTAAVFADWEWTQSGSVNVKNLFGLTAGKKYKVTFLLLKS